MNNPGTLIGHDLDLKPSVLLEPNANIVCPIGIATKQIAYIIFPSK